MPEVPLTIVLDRALSLVNSVVKCGSSGTRADRTAFEESALLVELHPIIDCGVKASPR
jgi:hypothetical protein